MSFAARFAILFLVLMSCGALVGCSGSNDTVPESEIPDIPPTTRTMPGDDGGKTSDFTPAPPPN